MAIIIKPCSTEADFKAFVQFPFDLYKGDKYWVPPMKSDEIKALQPATNPAFANCDAQFWLAIDNGKVVGRVGAIINKLYNQKTGEDLCRVSRIEFVDDQKVSAALLATAEKWAKEQGMKGIHGPLGFTNLDHQAIMIEGFEHMPSIGSEYHLPYYLAHFDAAGYQKEMDWVEFRITQEKTLPEKALKINDLIRKRYDLKVIHFTSQAQLKAYAQRIFHLLNISFGELFGFIEMDNTIAEFYINKYFSILNPKFVKVIEDKDGNVIGFIVSIPSLSEAMQKANGKLFPFGWWHITRALKKPKVVDLLLTAVHPSWQAQGVSALLITELSKVLIEHNVQFVETTGMLENNEKAINHWKSFNHIQHKRKRCFRKMF
ncbi:MAG: GNAT family N-acetyltransferase [Chitinophagaceae bacterium]|nr:GNAT family N-acetyltransferase [Chitinophagaceae bacterium]